MRPLLVPSLVTAAALLVPQLVSAHATPVSYQPEADIVLTETPQQVRIRFSERIEPGASSIDVYSASGTLLNASDATVDTQDPRLLTASIGTAGSGTYSVSWSVISADDGHFTKGAFGFSVGAASAAVSGGGFAVTHSSNVPEAAMIWLELLGHALLLGTLSVMYLLRRYGHEDDSMRRRSRHAAMTGAACAVAGALGYLALKVSALAAAQNVGWMQAATNFAGTATGGNALARIGLITLYSAVATAWRSAPSHDARRRNMRDGTLLLLLIAWALARARVSHAAASQTLPMLSVLINALHVLGKNLWIGTMAVFVPLALASGVRRTTRDIATWLTVAGILTNLGLILGGSTGTYIIWLHLKSAANISTTLWGARFMMLSLAATVLLITGLYRQLVLQRAAQRLLQDAADATAIETMRSGLLWLMFEAMCGMLVLFLSGMMIITTPPLDAREGWSAARESQGVTIGLSEHPYDDGGIRLTFSDDTVNAVTVTATNSEKNIGPLVVPVHQTFPGGYLFAKHTLSPPGNWTIDVTGQRTQGYDATASFSVLSPFPPEAEGRHSATLTLILAIGFLLVLLGGYALLRRSAHSLACLRDAAHVDADPLSASGNPRVSIGGDAPPDSSADTAAFDWSRQQRRAATIVSALLLFVLASGLQMHGGFMASCTEHGDMFHESVPVQNGRAVSNTPVLGCMTGMGAGQQHFGDMREYTHYVRPAKAVVTMRINPQVPVLHEPVTLTFSFTDPVTGSPITPTPEHERLLHAIVVSGDTTWFSHDHAEDMGPITASAKDKGAFEVTTVFHQIGRNLVALDYSVRSTHFSELFYADVPGEAQPVSSGIITQPGMTSTVSGQFDAYKVRLQLPAQGLKAGVPAKISYLITDEAGNPVTDLQPYLGAAMHIAAVREDLRKFAHVHGAVPLTLWQTIEPSLPFTHPLPLTHVLPPDAFGPQIDATIIFPSSGTYVIFGEFRHKGKTVVTRFAVRVM